MTDLDRLERLARAATRGPWRHYHDKLRPQFSTVIDEIQSSQGKSVVAWGGFDAADYSKAQNRKNAAFIATCNPSTILELVAELKEARKLPVGVREKHGTLLP